MAGDTLFYHWSLAPEGQLFNGTSVCLETLAKLAVDRRTDG